MTRYIPLSAGTVSINSLIIGPILRQLGWNTSNPDEVRPRYSVKHRRVDYALLINNTAKVFIEVIRGGRALQRRQKQLLRDVFHHGVEITVLTNLKTWWIYLPIRTVSGDRRKVVTVKLDQHDNTEAAHTLTDLLSKENVKSGRAIQNVAWRGN